MAAVIATLISAMAAIIAASTTVYLTKQKERQAEWRAKKLIYYEELFEASSGIVGEGTPAAAKMRFANAVNNLHLIGSQPVIDALHAFCNHIAESNADHSKVVHDELWSALIWHIRDDLHDPPAKPLGEFHAHLWASGTGANSSPGR
jgi:hypothetical protein